MEAMSLRARWVLPIAGCAIDGGYVQIGGGRIVAVDAARPPGPVEDLGDVALLPGFVNAHTHLEFSDLATPLGAPGMSLPDWIRLVIAQRKRRDHDAPAAIAEGCRESLAAGVTTVGEIAAAGAEAYSGLEGAPALLPFQEVLGFSGPRVDSAYSELVRRYEAAA
ncbi:MAG TPA: amidohydrolase family protein, partial [Lacipirellulaceae bacterium]|nr:amidohydrolase family protein [Lacipirellulaceae bacterium]